MNALTARRWVPLTLVGLMIGGAAIAAALATPGVRAVPPPHATPPAVRLSNGSTLSQPTATAATPRPALGSQMHVPAWLQTAVGYFCATIGLALLAFLVWRLIRFGLETRANRPADAGEITDVLVARRAAVLAAVDASIAELAREDGDARAAVIACWVRLEEVAAAAGTAREPGDSPAELVNRLLGAHQISVSVLRTLADLYRAARYGTHEIDSSMRGRARVALGQLRLELETSRSGPLGPDDAPSLAYAAVPDAVDRPRPGAPDDHLPHPRRRPFEEESR